MNSSLIGSWVKRDSLKWRMDPASLNHLLNARNVEGKCTKYVRCTSDVWRRNRKFSCWFRESFVQNQRRGFETSTFSDFRFVCDKCDPDSKSCREKLHEEFSAKLLPKTTLSQHIQARVDEFLRNRHLQVGNVTVRLIASSKEYTYVKNVSKLRWESHKTKFCFYTRNMIDTLCYYNMYN